MSLYNLCMMIFHLNEVMVNYEKFLNNGQVTFVQVA